VTPSARDDSPRSSQPWPALALILAVALLVRLWGIGYGLPWLFYFHDEPQVVLRALRFGTGDLNPHFFIWPGITLLYLAFLAYVALFAWGRALGWWSGPAGFAAAYFRDPTPFYLLPRLQTVAFGVGTVWLTWRLGASAYSPAVGLAAAIGLALNALHAHYSHFAHPVTWMTAFTVLGLWAAERVAGGGRTRALWLGAVAVGVGAATQYHAALLLVPLSVAVAYRALSARGAERMRWWVRGAGAGLLSGVVFLALSPYVVLDHPTFRADLSWISAKTEGRLGGAESLPLVEGTVLFWRNCMFPALSAPLAIAAMAGSVLAAFRRTRMDVILLSFLVAYSALAARAVVLNDRYAIPLLVPCLLLAARAIEEAWGWIRGPVPRRARAVAAAVVLLGLPSTMQLIEQDWTMTRGDTRVEALRWFESHVPAGDRVMIDMLQFWNTASPPLAEDATRLQERIAEIGRGVSGAGHSAAYLPYFQYRLAHPRHPAYYLRSTVMGTAVEPLDRLRAQGFRWAVVSEEAAAAHRTPARGDSSGFRYYRQLEGEAVLAAEFRPRRWHRLGPRIRIYRLDPPGRS
jgi:hypothetical protein